MNEQDIIKRIENDTKDLPIPDSISPSNMEKMLNEHIEQEDGETSSKADNIKNNSVTGSGTDGGRKDSDKVKSIMSSMRRRRIGLAFAACFGVIIIGSGAFGIIRHNMDNGRNYSTDTAALTESANEEEYEEAADEAAPANDPESSYAADGSSPSDDEILEAKKLSDEEIEKKENEQLEKDLVASGVLSKPDSYEDYYDTMYSAYKESVKNYMLQTNDIDIAEESVEDSDIGGAEYEAADEATEAAMEESAPAAEADLRSATKQYDSAANSITADTTSGSGKEADEKDYSSTNTQEKAVDEGDIVKTDGKYIYTANRHGYYSYSYDDVFPTISITRASNGKLTNVSTITLDVPETSGTVNYMLEEFYIYKNYLIVLYQKSTQKKPNIYNNYNDFDGNYDMEEYYDDYYNGYYYDYDSWLFSRQSCIEIYDITDKKNPEKVNTLFQSGSYNSSRISDGYLYTISYFEPETLAFHDYRKGRTNYSDYVPYINDERIAYNDIYYSRHLETLGTYVITSVDLSSPTRFTNSKAVSSSNSQVYVGEKSIYLYRTIYDDIEKTEIMRIGYSKGNLYIGNRAMIAGYLYGPFALSEYNKHLRIVSTIPANNFSWYDSGVWRTDTNSSGFTTRINEDINAVYVLDENMHLTGRITGLAPGEMIYSARFFGDIGYFVTYKNTDPLFSVDFSNPKEPKILGQLKIPGFSNYLHFYGTDTLLGIGEERDPYTQDFKGLKLSMFDIKDPANVTEADKLILKNVYYSSAQYDYKSIMIDPDKNVFGFIYEYEDYNSNGDYTYYYCYSTYTYDSDKGFIETARYKVDYDYMYDLGYVRGLYIGDYFYLVTPESIESYRLGSEDMIDRIYLD
ncbi:MAG: beta-propeller domain-containing protein [Lachnospiraceae bacterium]|nr:beta-propeller domain-containing protein [Lachnospiraceae bacterium]